MLRKGDVIHLGSIPEVAARSMDLKAAGTQFDVLIDVKKKVFDILITKDDVEYEQQQFEI